MRITSISAQKKRPDRYSVYVDDEFVFGISQDDLLRLGLYSGQDVTNQELEEFKRDAEYSKARQKALSYLGVRPRSQKEVTDYLSRKGYEDELIDKVISRLNELELINDEKFAFDWVQWRQATTPRSRRKLWAELKQKGIDNESIEAALETIDDSAELKTLRQIIDKRGERYASREKLLGYLSRQGFSYDVINRALTETEDESDSAHD